MAVGAEHAAAIEVVEQHELVDQLVMVGRHLLAEDAQIGVAVAPLHVAEHLVVGAVLLDDVQHVLDRRGLAMTLRNRPWRRIAHGGARALIVSVWRLLASTVCV